MTDGRRFPIRFSRAGRAMAVVGITPPGSYVELTDDALHVRMGWGFHATAPLSSVTTVAPADGRVLGVPVRPRALRVSVEDPDDLVDALTLARR